MGNNLAAGTEAGTIYRVISAEIETGSAGRRFYSGPDVLPLFSFLSLHRPCRIIRSNSRFISFGDKWHVECRGRIRERRAGRGGRERARKGEGKRRLIRKFEPRAIIFAQNEGSQLCSSSFAPFRYCEPFQVPINCNSPTLSLTPKLITLNLIVVINNLLNLILYHSVNFKDSI